MVKVPRAPAEIRSHANAAADSRVPVECAAIGFSAVVLSVWFFSGQGSDRLRLVLSDLALPAAALSAAAGCLWRSKRCHRQVRSTWILLGLAALSWGAGQLYASASEVFLHHSVPLPSPADIGYLGAVPLFGIALLRLSGGADGWATRLVPCLTACWWPPASS